MSQLTASDSPHTDHTGPYVLHNILDSVPLSEDGAQKGLFITCVEFWDGNLYIGTSAAEILHYVLIPAGPDPAEKAQFILATRLPLSPSDGTVLPASQAGVQQILVLPSVGKASILCNGNVTFYTLPELSPVFTNTKLSNCSWVGGIDLDESMQDGANPDGVVIAICQKKVRLVRVGDRLQRVREVDFAGCSTIIRRGNIACIADARSYSLLDVVERQRIPLSAISSAREEEITVEPHQSNGINSRDASATRPSSKPVTIISEVVAVDDAKIRSRDASPASLGTQAASTDPTTTVFPSRGSSLQVPQAASKSPQRPPQSLDGETSNRRSSSARPQSRSRQGRTVALPPNIASPTHHEFLVTTGTTMDEPGVGMFVNLDGDVIRGTLEFSNYPESLCVDLMTSNDPSTNDTSDSDPEGFVLAIVNRTQGEQVTKALEIQDWKPESGNVTKNWIDIPNTEQTDTDTDLQAHFPSVGMRSSISQSEVVNYDIAELLGLRRLALRASSSLEDGTKSSSVDVVSDHVKTDASFMARMSTIPARVLLWRGNCVWWAVCNPSLIRLDAQLSKAVENQEGGVAVNRQLINITIEQLSGLEPQTELEFLGLKYLRQRGSLLLFADYTGRVLAEEQVDPDVTQLVERALLGGEVDPRIVLAMLPVLREEIVEEDEGILVSNGLKELVELFIQGHDLSRSFDPDNGLDNNTLQLIKRYLQAWRKKKGFGSIAAEIQVFYSIDAALLHTLLILDSKTPKGTATKGSVRSELNTLVDHAVDCGDRAIELLEAFKRLYVLSRLYQGRKQPEKVLATWRRIVEGEEDAAGQFTGAENEIGRYLTKISDPTLVEEYGGWLAARNPTLGVRVFTDSSSKVKFSPARAVEILRERAPDAVKDFLEHLVFDKHLAAYANDLISYYLTSVLSTLSSSSDARNFLLSTYSTYRSLRPPKPPYTAFATDNALPDAWYGNRLRLLQLLGGSHATASQYDVEAILERIAQFEEELVPEMIVLRGRQGRHQEAIRLLTHGLGDFDTAVSYCVLGGASIYSPTASTDTTAAPIPPTREQQMSLFSSLLVEFLRIPDADDRLAQTGELLTRFAPWFDITDVLATVPEEWALGVLTGFLESAVRKLVAEKRETAIQRALVGAENLVASTDLIEKIERAGPRIEIGDSVDQVRT